MRFRVVIFILGLLIFFVGFSMILPLAAALYYGDGDAEGILYSMLLTMGSGGILALLFRRREEMRIKDGFAIVSGGWVAMTIFGMLPFMLTGTTRSVIDAFFETMSGFTTTGATVFADVEIIPRGVMLWRCQTQWIGGMGIIVLSLAILPFLGVGGMQLFKAEVPGPTLDKLRPRIGQTAKLLWGVYLLLSALEVLLLVIGGMPLYDSICHTFTTMATGGFSTKNASIGAFNNPFVEYVIIFFMFVAGVNFAHHFRALTGDFRGYRRSWEFALYCLITVGASALILGQVWGEPYSDAEYAVRSVLFQVVSIGTTTGFGTADYVQWGFASQFILLLLMFIGGCSGSTGGGMKVMRIGLVVKNSEIELRKLLHPSAVIPVRMGDQVVSSQVLSNIMGFFTLYVGVFTLGVLVLALFNVDLITAIGASAACIGNIGPGLGAVGPTATYALIPGAGKLFLAFAMLLGRLELYTVMVIFSRTFWRV